MITPYWFLSSSSAAGTMLKLAAIGVIKVPQKPLSIPTAPITAAIAAVLVDEDRDPDRRDHHRKCGEGIAHDHREHNHAERVEQHGEEDAAARNDRARERADRSTDTCGREDHAQRRQHLRKHQRPSRSNPPNVRPRQPEPGPAGAAKRSRR